LPKRSRGLKLRVFVDSSVFIYGLEFDADFQSFEENHTPKQFVEVLGKRPCEVEW